MPQKFPLDVILEQGDVQETGPREALVIRKIGTSASDPTDPAKLVIDKRPTGPITQTLSPLSMTNALFVGLLELGSLYYVVPPETEVIVDGPAGEELRCVGEILKLAVGESMPGTLMSRFAAQQFHYLTFGYGTVDWAAGYAFADGEEVEVLKFEPSTIEEYLVKGLLEAKCPDWSRAPHEIGLRFYADNVPLDFLLKTTPIGGLDLYDLPYPPAETTEHVGYVFPEPGVKVPSDHVLGIRQRNISGAVINIGAVAGNGPYVAAVCEYTKRAA